MVNNNKVASLHPAPPDEYFEVHVQDFRRRGLLHDAGIAVDDDTEAFEKAIHLIEQHGGGRLVVSGGFESDDRHFHIRPINLTSHMIFFLGLDVTISAIPNKDLWPVIPPLPSYGQGRDHPGPRFTSLIHGEHLVNVTIQGSSRETSVIDGVGEYWWKLREAGQDRYTRGHLIEFMYSNQIRIYNINLRNSPFWTNHFFDCNDVHVQNNSVYAPESGAPNTDGWDPDSSTNVLIEHSEYHGGDDCVAIKSGWDCFGVEYNKPTVNVTIRNLTCQGHSASVSIGSEMSGGVANVLVQNVTYLMANHAAKVKVGNTRGGYVRNITYQNISSTGDLDSALHVDMYHFFNHPNPSCPSDWKPDHLPVVDRILFDGIFGLQTHILTNETFHLIGMTEQPVTNLHLQNVYFPEQSGPDAVPWNCSAVHGTVLDQTVQPWPPCSELKIVYPRILSHNARQYQQQPAWQPCLLVLIVVLLVCRKVIPGHTFTKLIS